MSSLKVSVSGIRGIWGESLKLDNLLKYTVSFGRYVLAHGGKRVLLGRDARPTGELIAAYSASILNGMGIDTADAGIVPTPTILFGVRKMGFDAGLIITASHNPVEWNALKFVKAGGVFTGEKDLAEILGYMDMPSLEAHYSKVGHHSAAGAVTEAHLEGVINSVNAALIRSKKFKVILDPVNSAGGPITKTLLERLGCDVKVVNGEIHGGFDRGTEPTPKNLVHLEKDMSAFKADAGFAQDPDADRLVLIDENGRVLSEEWTLALALEAVLRTRKGPVVINLSTSMINQIIAEKYGCALYRSKVGEANVVEGIEEHKALIGGEGNGGVIYPAINTARDSLTGIALVLELMAVTGQTMSGLTAGFPALTNIKEKFDFSGELAAVYQKVRGYFQGAAADERDGLRLDWGKPGARTWLHLRASNTEPVVRLIAESEAPGDAEKAMDAVRNLLK